MTVSPEVLAAVVSGALALIGIVLGLRAQRSVERFKRGLDEEQRLGRLVDRYQEPLVRAAYDLQSRLHNIVEGDFLQVYHKGPSGVTTEYAVGSTVWLFGQYLGWVEIVRREAQFLHRPTVEARRQLQTLLDEVTSVLGSDRAIADPLFRIFRSEQRALGEVMITTGSDAEGNPRLDCLGYAAFTTVYAQEDSSQRIWFQPLRQAVEKLAEDPTRTARLRVLQSTLVDSIDLLDAEKVRFTGRRERLVERPRT